MNYLAHLYLSGKDQGLLVGNFIGDYVKGRQFTRYSGTIQTGILLHRHIDGFTDSHPEFLKSASFFKEGYHRYAGVVCDIVYDHFLAAYWSGYSDISLNEFVSRAHRILIKHYFSLPLKVKQFLPFLIKSRRLENYQFLDGVEKTLRIMSSHSSLPDNTAYALRQLEKNYGALWQQFSRFMPEMEASVRGFLESPQRFISFDHTALSG
ncbi:acyl carrier protein phosphodiesterase [Thermophagus sp. OGC60D27]|uniref:acyl carrier protein phosphodiesterase n=1 Tax=Thermophagus sp. OGC60D27 TaxID=3458415 RepID=UPI004037C1A1